jgi:hypothetical protein
MDALTRKKTQRFKFLDSLYTCTDGRSSAIVNMYELGEQAGLTREESADVVEFLADEYLVEHVTLGGGISITHNGVVQIEAARSHPEEETEYFPPVVNIVSVGQMVNPHSSRAPPVCSERFDYGGGGDGPACASGGGTTVYR